MKKVCNRFFAVIFLLSAMPCKLISQQDLNLSVEGILKLPKDTIVNGDMHFREKLNDVVLKNPEKKGVALVCPSSSALKVAGYIPSVVANNMASSIKISAKSPYGFEISGVLNFAHSRTFSRIKKELEGNIFLLEQSYFDYVEKTIHCVYQIGQNKIELKNQDVDITACPPLKNFTVHPGARYLSMDLFKKNGNIVTATIEIQEKGTYIEGKQIDCSVFVSEKNVPQ